MWSLTAGINDSRFTRPPAVTQLSKMGNSSHGITSLYLTYQICQTHQNQNSCWTNYISMHKSITVMVIDLFTIFTCFLVIFILNIIYPLVSHFTIPFVFPPLPTPPVMFFITFSPFYTIEVNLFKLADKIPWHLGASFKFSNFVL